MNQKLSEKWIKASIIGTIWAASEIVLGSFLHNLKIPLSGNILTAIGLVILISISFTWTDKGLFWRAGLICSLMKTMSPSAVIFGPMIAIFAESVLLELFVRLSGRTLAGYILGAMAAMSWNLFQQIANYIIFYGSNIIEVYSNLLNLAQKQLHIQTSIVWLPIIILLVAYALFGLLAGVIGIMTGRKMLNNPASVIPLNRNKPAREFLQKSKDDFNYSVPWLFIDLVLIIGSFIFLNRTSWIVWSLAITGIIIIWSLRYKRALRQISKPKFWIFFVIITLLTAFVFTKAKTGEDILRQGLLTGFQMNFRAAVIIAGFSVLGTELYNPVIRSYFLRTSFKNLPLALELSAESLPEFIASIPDLKTLLKNPVSIFCQVISQADMKLTEIRKNSLQEQEIFIVTGSVGEGKTTFVKKLVEVFKQDGIKAVGILSERVMADSGTIGYDVSDIETEERKVFLRENGESGKDTIGRFAISPEGLAFGKSILASLVSPGNRIVVIDEIGLLELNGKGWSGSLNDLLEKQQNLILITVRDSFVGKVKEKWNLQKVTVFRIAETDYNKAASAISEQYHLMLQKGNI
jgi:nucleoside-triphosphatase THEP1